MSFVAHVATSYHQPYRNSFTPAKQDGKYCNSETKRKNLAYCSFSSFREHFQIKALNLIPYL